MKNVYTWAAKPAKRSTTVGDLKAAKGKRKFTQVTANSIEEAAAAEKAGFDMIIANAKNIIPVREGSKNLFLTAALVLNEFVTADDIMRGAFKALENGADAVMTPRSMDIVEMLAKEDVPVMGHLGLVPRKSTWIGGLRAGTSSFANISTMSILRGVITASAPFSKALNAPRIMSSAVTYSFKTKAAVKKRFFDPSLTGITFLALAIIMSKPAFSAADASSVVFAVT